jgi:hypothetical protein
MTKKIESFEGLEKEFNNKNKWKDEQDLLSAYVMVM